MKQLGWLPVFALSLMISQMAPVVGQEDEFYHNKTVSLIIPIDPGGAYDAYGRLVAKYIGKYLGGPVVVPRNMPGAGGAAATNYLTNIAPKDGTVLIIITSSFATDQILHNAQIKYDARRIPAIGRLVDTRSVLFFWHDAPIKTAKDLWTIDSTIANSTLNGLPAARLMMMNLLLGTKMKLIAGYPSAKDFVLASERGEADGGATTYIGLLQLFPSYIAEKKINVVLQFGMTRDSALPEVPALLEYTQDPEARQIFNFLVSNDEIGRSLFTTPGTPPARVALLRRAFDKMIADPDFRTEAERLNLPLDTKSGDEMEKVVADTFNISEKEIEKIKEVSAR
jgi:tripartite-type tricarboxylate transporter receptor subunit TctC